jgi:hypothetical protein
MHSDRDKIIYYVYNQNARTYAYNEIICMICIYNVYMFIYLDIMTNREKKLKTAEPSTCRLAAVVLCYYDIVDDFFFL